MTGSVAVIAAELAQLGAARVVVTQRRQRYVLPKFAAGVPSDHRIFTRYGTLANETLPAAEIDRQLKEIVVEAGPIGRILLCRWNFRRAGSRTPGATRSRGGHFAMNVLRTPDEQFVHLPGYQFTPSYVQVETKGVPALRMHYVDVGPADGPAVVLLHGQPTWSYLYRDVIHVLREAGLRVIAPDHIGFGRSDKLTEPTDYTFARHIDWVYGLIRGLDLREITLVVQDWGGPIGLSVLARDPDRFARVVATNTILHTCDPALAGTLAWAHHGVGDDRVMLAEALLDYVLFYQRSPDIVPSFFLNAVAGPLPADVLAAYDAPFPDRSYKAGLRQLTALVPLTRNDLGAAIGRATMAELERWHRPFLTAYSDGDPATRGWDKVFRERIPGAGGQNHTTVSGAGHFVQEQKGAELGRIVAEFISGTS